MKQTKAAAPEMGRFDHGGDTYGLEGVVDLSANLNPLGMPVQVMRAIKVAAGSFETYPDPHCRELVGLIALKEQVGPDSIIATAGATDAFWRIAAATKPHQVLVCSPTYSGYEQALVPFHPRIVHHSLVARENFDVTERIIDYIQPDIDLIALCSPNNPTGRTIPRDLLAKILRAADRWGTKVLVDECFIDFTDEASCAPLIQSNPHLIVVKALTKSHALAGFRIGYCLSGDADLTSAIRAAGAPWAVSSPAQIAAKAALEVPGYLDLTREYVQAERERLETGLAELGMFVVPSQANFILFRSPQPIFDDLLERGYLIRRCQNFRGLDDSWYRIAVRTTVQNKGFLGALSETMQ